MNISEVSQDIAVPALSKRQVTCKAYRLAHKEEIALYRKQWYDSHLESERQAQREYHVIHRAKHNEHSHEYYFENKDVLSEKQAEKSTCACGGRYTRSNKLKHERSNIHLRSLEVNEIIKG